MIKVVLLLSMLFCHLIDDYHIQGLLATFKQKKNWEEMPDLYRNDWKIALFEHAFSWTFMMMLPITVAALAGWISVTVIPYLCLFVANLLWHAFIDHLKCNSLKINLWEDQVAHIFQIVLTWIILVII